MDNSGNSRKNNKRHWGNTRRNIGDRDNRRNSGTLEHIERPLEFRKHRRNMPVTKIPVQVQEEMQKDLEAIRELKQKQPVCPRCGQPITDTASALAEHTTGEPVHFDCVLAHLKETETLKENERITYIGQGRFAVLFFPNIHDTRHFTIVRVIEWEGKDKTYPWREEYAGVYSQVH